jgi:hypothetical protein
MATDPTTEAVAHGVVSALGAAGLLQQGPGGLLLQPPAPLPQAPKVPPKPAHVVGDDVALQRDLSAISKVVSSPTLKVVGYILRFGATPTSAGDQHVFAFPPNDQSYIPELDRLLSVMGMVGAANSSGVNLGVSAQVTIDGVPADNMYNAILNRLEVGWSGNALAPWSIGR